MLQTRSQRWTASTILLCVVLVALSWFVLIAPSRSEASDLQQQAAAQETQNIALQQNIVTLKRQFATLPTTKASLASVLATMPITEDMPAVVDALRACEAHSGVKLISIVPGRGITLVPQAGKNSTTVVQTPITVTLTGKFFQVSAFVGDLRGARMTRAYLIGGLDLTSADSGSTSGDITVTVVGAIFSLPTVRAQIDKFEAVKAKAGAATSATASAATSTAASAG